MRKEQRLALARGLVIALETGREADAERLAAALTGGSVPQMMAEELVAIARELHDGFGGLIADQRLCEMAQDGMPDTRERLAYVIEKTEEAAHRTLAAVERMTPVVDEIVAGADLIDTMVARNTDARQFKGTAVRQQLTDFATDVRTQSATLRGGLSEVLMAQEYQDLVGQVVKRTIGLVSQIEDKLCSLIPADYARDVEATDPTVAEGPAIRRAPQVVNEQADVDALLADLGV